MEIRKANMKDIDKLFDIRMEFVQLMGVKEIIQDAKNRGVRRLLLNATDMGKPIYEKIGFQNTVKEMILTIE